jgi:hAT family C-terminal dimerisation region
MDLIDSRLTDYSLDKDMSPAIRASLGLAKKTLNRYYTMTDLSDVYRIAMGTYFQTSLAMCSYIISVVLHPRHKLAYFASAGWQQEWIDTAKSLVYDEFKRSYEHGSEEEEDADATVSSSTVSLIEYFVTIILILLQSSRNIFDDLPSLAQPKKSALRCELDRYLSTDVEVVSDVLAWWYERRAMFPCLSRMALDYLSIPGRLFSLITFVTLPAYGIVLTATSVDVERVFSRGRLLLSHVRSRLSAQSTRALLCLGSWSLMGMVRNEDVLAVTLMADAEDEDPAGLEEGWDHIGR